MKEFRELEVNQDKNTCLEVLEMNHNLFGNCNIIHHH
jgi:hypothetical protein